MPHRFRRGPNISRLVWNITGRARKPRFYLPDNISVVTDDEAKQLEDISPAEIRRLDDVQAKIATLKQTFDVDSLLHIHRITLLQKQTPHWFIIITTSVCAALILGTLCFLFYLRFHYIIRIVPKPNNTTCSSPSPTTALAIENVEPKTEQQEQRVLFHCTLRRATKPARKSTVTRSTARTFRELQPLHLPSRDNVTSPTFVPWKSRFSKLSRGYKNIAESKTLKIRNLFINVIILQLLCAYPFLPNSRYILFVLVHEYWISYLFCFSGWLVYIVVINHYKLLLPCITY